MLLPAGDFGEVCGPVHVVSGACALATAAAGSSAAGLDVLRVGIDELVLVCAPDWPAQDGLLRPADLADLPFVTAQRQSARRMIEDSALLEHGIVRKNVVLEFGHAEAIKRAVRCEVGCAFLFRCSIDDELAMGALRVIPIQELRIEVPIYLTKRRDKYLSAVQTALHSYFRSGGGLSGTPPGADLRTTEAALDRSNKTAPTRRRSPRAKLGD